MRTNITTSSMMSLVLAAVVALLVAKDGIAMGIPSVQEENEVVPNVTPQEPIDVELTVRLVRERLRADPSLPRLSRARVLRLLGQVAPEDAGVRQALQGLGPDDDDYDADDDLPFHHQQQQQQQQQAPPPSVVLLPPTSDARGEDLVEPHHDDDGGDGEDETEERRRQKALMLVLPFSARNMSEALVRDLYTRAPITRIVDDGEQQVTVKPQQPHDGKATRRPPSPLLHAQVAHAPSPPSPPRRTPPPTTPTSTTTTTTTAAPSTITTTIAAAAPTTYATPAPPAVRIAVSAEGAPSDGEGKFGASYSASAQVQPPAPVRVKVQTSYNSAPSGQEEKFGTSYSANSEESVPVRMKVRRPVVRKPVKRPLGGVPFTTTTTASPSSQPPPVVVTEVTRPLHASFAVMDAADAPPPPPPVLYMTPSPEQGPEVVLSSSQDAVAASNNAPHRYNSHYSANRLRPPLMEADPSKDGGGFTGAPESPVAAALAALGMQPDPAAAFAAANMAQRKKTSAPLPRPTQSPLPPPPSPEAEVSLGAAVAAPSLADDLQALLASWGLLPGASTPPPPPQPMAAPDDVPPTVDPLSYASFKPLPPIPLGQPAPSGTVRDSSALGGEMRDFLAAFGLVSDSERGRAQRGRNMKPSPLDFPIDMLTEDHLEVLRNLGLLIGRNGRRAARNKALSAAMPSPADAGAGDQRAAATKEHVFNPAQHLAALKPTPDEVRRLNKLLDTFKKYTKEKGEPSAEEVDILTQTPEEEAAATTVDPFANDTDDTESATSSSLDLLAEESEMTTRFPDQSTTNESPVDESATIKPKIIDSPLPLHQAVAPNPLDISELLLLLNATKNEVKRQEANNASTSTSSSASSSVTASASSSSSSSASASASSDTGASIDDLAASFGGSIDEEPSSTTPASGLYFLVDWNSFLEVGDPDGEKRVNVRIAPKVGDARRFLPVTVP